MNFSKAHFILAQMMKILKLFVMVTISHNQIIFKCFIYSTHYSTSNSNFQYLFVT